jgi:hypothetical protein
MLLIKENVERITDSPRAIALLKAKGYKEITKSVNESSINLQELSKDELKTLAKEKGLEGCASFTKDQLLEVLKDVV